jgi:hypothetical protein
MWDEKPQSSPFPPVGCDVTHRLLEGGERGMAKGASIRESAPLSPGPFGILVAAPYG